MALRQTKKISELPSLSPATMDTTFVVGISGSTTYKISINQLTSSLDTTFASDLVTNALSNSLDGKLNTSSFNSYTASISTASLVNRLNELEFSASKATSSITELYDNAFIWTQKFDLIDSISGSWITESETGSFTTTSSFNSYTASISTASLVTSILNLNTFTASQSTASLVTSIDNLNTYTASQSTASLVNRLNAIENVSGSWITESETGSFLTNLNGAISGSSQLTSSYDSRYSLSGSILTSFSQSVDSRLDNIELKTGSYATTGSNHFYGDQIFIGNELSQSVELVAGEYYGGGVVFYVVSGSYALIVDENDLGAAQAQYMQIATDATSTNGIINQNRILARSGSTPNAFADINNPARANYGLDMEDPAVMAYSSSVGGYTDWYIPSTTEIALINGGVGYTRIYEGFSTDSRYWTSNYAGSPYTYYVSDGQGRTSRILGEGSNGGSTQHPVVAIRKINRSYREVYGNANIIVSGSLNVSGSITGSTNFNTIVNKPTLISGSSQLTSSYDTRYVLSGSITQTTWDNIASKPAGIVSGSSQVLGGSGVVSGSYETTGRGIISSSANLVTTSSFNTYTASISTASLVTSISNLNTFTASQSTSSLVNRLNAIESVSGSWITESETGSLQTSITNLNTFTQSFSTSVDSRIDTLEATIISGSPNYTQVLGNQRVTSTSGTSIISGSITTSGNPVQIIVTGDANPIVTTGQWCTLQIYRNDSAIGGVVQVEAANANENQAYCVNVIDTPSAGTYTYSLRMTANGGGNFQFGEATGPVLTAVELRTNTNLPSTNNTFTGLNRFNGQVTLGAGGGDEGGELHFATAETNTTLSGSYVSVDIYRDRLRIFDGAGGFKGAHLDISKLPDGITAELMWKVSGFVNAGTFLTLDNLKVSVTTGGSRGLSVGAVSTNFTANIAGWYGLVGGGNGYSANNIGYTTTASTSAFSWSFPTEGDTSQYNILDKTNSRFYRVTLMIGAAYNNNFISIERLY